MFPWLRVMHLWWYFVLQSCTLLALQGGGRVAAIKLVGSEARAASARSLALAVPLGAIGMAGLLRDAWPGAPHLSGFNLHAIFGAVLWLAVVAQFGHANLTSARLSGAGVHELCRRLSRGIYLLLYVLFGASQLLRLAAILWNSGTRGASHPAILTTPESLRDYLLYGVFALLTIRVLAAVQCHELNRAAAR